MASLPKPAPTLDASSLEHAINTLQERMDSLKSALAQQQKLATLGMVTAVLAHEFNNILTPMINYTRISLSDKSDDALRIKALQKALTGSERLAAISKSLLGFSRGDDSTLADVKTCITETLNCLSREPAKDGITLTIEVEANLVVAMNAGQLQQVLMNLIVNARSAILSNSRSSRRLTIKAATLPNGRCSMSVTDSGPGIDPAIQKSIFQPFFSTKSRDETCIGDEPPKGGTGLGLTICQELLAAVGAEISVQSELGRGATFLLDLPKSPDTASVKS